ncbi:hypothetical protein AXF42_Ash004300 [Apostasia shenzhenica]|uniref:Polymerase nucleotidyl transferase domain-containing protein n=1 Tax=Apostasia shenzhenica TaxID=1088818 RepID=A0A2I0A2J2_9ASPA|nr:hypothetical protein AXF42_Ash004300 [Apostasia shenzhenica]
MDEHEGWTQPGGLQPNGLLPNETANVTMVLDTERWSKAEERTAELIARIQPNRPSEERRNAVANYVQRLIMKCFSCEVFTFGSVPLKTYLPDGDIDLTAFSENEDLKTTWANEVREVLESEERSESAEFRVKEVQYIQAEVKIIKCLVENIVVDISFNQVGGLCTLCFLEEIDHLINQNHLFKRSIILIKAWCYYESRILGAHHGLISTYALETLVLYIFHVFNNSFSGPLEVLYRFLEFFSNFDWDNFCVSLWGPVPICSLPDMNAEPPRKDGGELLLSKPFLEACSGVYAVFPAGQENQTQQFVSKHFNVIDPLRTNNNLGRSVSKGNFYRIRSAFAFGAKKLANLLYCPQEDLIAEINQFFMNTWERHGSGNRPDAPVPGICYVRPLHNGPSEEHNNSRSTSGLKKKNESVGNEHQTQRGRPLHGYASHVLHSITQPSHTAYRTSNSSLIAHNLCQKNNVDQTNLRDSDSDRNASSSLSAQPDKVPKNSKPDFSVRYVEGQSRFQFARTRSSPELTEATADVQSRLRHYRVVAAGKTHNEQSRSDYGSRRKNTGSEILGVQSERSYQNDPSSLSHSSSHQSLDFATNSNSASNSCQDDSSGFTTVVEDHTSVSEALELQQQEEQNLVNMMASSQIHNFNGQVQLPIHLASPHIPLPLSSVLASMGYHQRNFTGIVPSNITLIDPSWGSAMQFPQGFIPSPLPQYFPNVSVSSNSEEIESGNDISSVTEMSSEDGKQSAWQDGDHGSTRVIGTENGLPQPRCSDERKQSPASRFSYSLSQRSSTSAASSMSGNHKISTENRGPRDEYLDAWHQSSRASDKSSADKNVNLRFFPMNQASSSRSKPSAEPSRAVLNVKVSKSARDRWGRKPSVSAVVTSLHGKAISGWQVEGASEHISSPQEDDESRDWVNISTASTNNSDHTVESSSLGTTYAKNQLSRYEPAQTSGADSVIPMAPMLVGGSRNRVADNSGVLPFAFYPTGPPVPFVTMLPFYNFPADGTNADVSTNQIDADDGGEQVRTPPSEQNFHSVDNHGQSEGPLNLISSNEPNEEHKSDILNSDFASHWQNLQYGRLCQNIPNHGQFIYSPPVMVPPVYLQGHFPLDGPGRPLAPNLNFFTQMMGYGPRLVPVAPLQPGPSRPSNVFHRYGDEPPRYRAGTGTYLPNPKATFRDRHYSSTRNHRGTYNYDRGDADREGSWVNSKNRSGGRSHGRNHNEKLSLRPDRLAASDVRNERVWESYRHEQAVPHQVQNSSFGSSTTSLNSANVAHGMYPVSGASSNGLAGPAVPSVVMLYPYEQGVNYVSSAESLEFGSLGPVHLSNNELPRSSDGNPIRRIHDQRHGAHIGNSLRSSPDQPSSPQILRDL